MSRWTALFFIAIGQLMIVLDTTVVNIAIPTAQSDLHMSDGGRQWVVAAYTLAFGGLLLFGGRLTDLIGRKRAFVTGLAGFAVASAIGGASVNGGMLIAARAMQGASGALLSPAALAMITVMFTEARERGRAFGIYNAVAGSGLAAGLMLGGVVTEYLNWRWALYLSIPFAVISGAGAATVIGEPPGDLRGIRRLDLPGAFLSTAGLLAMVLAVASAASGGRVTAAAGWLSAAALVALGAFALVESRTREPLLPPRLIADRNRGGACLALGLAVMTLFAVFLFMTYYLQTIRGYTPLATGLGFLPMVVALVIGSTQIAGRVLPLVAPRLLISSGFAAAIAGMLILTRLTVGSSYPAILLPAGILIGLGLGTAFVPAMSLATADVAPGDTGAASALVNAVQELGGAIGTVLLNSIAVSATASYLGSHLVPGRLDEVRLAATVHGYTTATWWAAGILLLAAIVTVVMVTSGPPAADPTAAPARPINSDNAEGSHAKQARKQPGFG